MQRDCNLEEVIASTRDAINECIAEERREAARASARRNGTGTHEAPPEGEPPRPALVRIPASQLRRLPPAERWLWTGLVPCGMTTILSALPKAGKTTLMAHLLRAMEAGGDFCGQEVRAGRAVYVTEESETLWADRRDRLGLKDHCEFIVRPFCTKPTHAEWRDFLARLTDSLAARPADLVVMDTLARLWPVQNENDASEVTAALMPLLEIPYRKGPALTLVHHLRKAEGLEATATRGSGGITASVDSILELRRYRPGDRKDRRRVICCDSRFDDRLDEAVFELIEDGTAYTIHGDRATTARAELLPSLLLAVPAGSPGLTLEALREAWPADDPPSQNAIREALRHAMEQGLVFRAGEGRSGSPYRYYRPGTDPEC